MMVIGLDPSTKTGWVVLDYSDTEGVKLIAFGEWHFPKKKGIARVKAMADSLYKVLDTFEPDIAIIEGYGYANKHTLATLVEIGGVLRYTLHIYRLKYAEIPPNSLKKFVTGKGNSTKDVMISHAFRKWGFKGTDNEVDAYGLAMFAYALLGYYTSKQIEMDSVRKWSVENEDFIKSLRFIENNCN